MEEAILQDAGAEGSFTAGFVCAVAGSPALMVAYSCSFSVLSLLQEGSRLLLVPDRGVICGLIHVHAVLVILLSFLFSLFSFPLRTLSQLPISLGNACRSQTSLAWEVNGPYARLVFFVSVKDILKIGLLELIIGVLLGLGSCGLGGDGSKPLIQRCKYGRCC